MFSLSVTETKAKLHLPIKYRTKLMFTMRIRVFNKVRKNKVFGNLLLIFRRIAKTKTNEDHPKCKRGALPDNGFHYAGILQQHLLWSNSTLIEICFNRISSIVLSPPYHSCFIPLWYVLDAIFRLRASLRSVYIFSWPVDYDCCSNHPLCDGPSFNGLCL